MSNKQGDLLKVSNVLNNTRVFHKIAEALGVSIDTNDEFFWDIEKVILKNFKRMNKERYGN